MANKPNYTLSAFTEPAHLVVLVVAMVGLIAVLGMQGMAVAAVAELLYLVLVPRMVPYKARVNQKSEVKALADRPSNREVKAAALSRDVRRRYQVVVDTYKSVVKHPGAMPVSKDDLEDLMDAVLELMLVVQQHAEAERRTPIEDLRTKGADAMVAEREILAAHAAKAEAQVNKVEATLQSLLGRSAAARVEGATDTNKVASNIEATIRTAREMAAFEIQGGS